MIFSPHRPFDPKRVPFFYGWVVLVVGMVGALASVPGQTAGVSVFTDDLIAATQLSRVRLSNAYLVGTLASGLLIPYGGRLLDRYGCRRSAIAAALGLSCALLGLSHIDRVPSGWIVWGALCLAFVLLRFSGQGMLTLSSRVMVTKWFDKRRGLVSGIYAVVVSLGFSMAPVALAFGIGAAGGWQRAWIAMALSLALGFTTFAYFFFRDSPEACGLVMDGTRELAAEASLESSNIQSDHNATRAEAVRSAAFWIITIALCIHAGAFTGLTFHIVDVGKAAGLVKEESVALFPPIAFVGVFIGFIAGALTDRFRLRFFVAAILCAQCLGYGSLAWLDTRVGFLLATFGVGCTSGLYGSLSLVSIPKLFGRTYLGAISSAQMSALVIASALGPAFLALSKNITGDYGPAFLAIAGLPLLLLVFLIVVRRPSHTAQNTW